jgi:hypothetical protein
LLAVDITAVPYAFSIHHFVSSVGDDAGLVSIIGLLVMAVLYFVQARETAGVRRELRQNFLRTAELERHASKLVPKPELAPPGRREPPAPPDPARRIPMLPSRTAHQRARLRSVDPAALPAA